MIGYNERQEALNLWSLLQESQQLLQKFNESTEEIAKACDVADMKDAEAVQAARVKWYVSLSLRMRALRRSGQYAMPFLHADKAQRHFYDLLARLEVQDVELEAYDRTLPKLSEAERGPLSEEERNALQAQASAEAEPVPEESEEPTFEVDGFRVLRMACLEGLMDPKDVRRARILYDRLLRIQPMRELMGRLSSLLKAMKQAAPTDDHMDPKEVWLDAKTMENLNKVVTDSFCKPIACVQDRKSGASLNLDGNNFTILDRLMDNWDKPLAEEAEFRLPIDAIRKAGSVPSLLTAGIVRKVAATAAGEGAPASKARQYVPIPGGHTMLGIYDSTERDSPEKFFQTVAQHQALPEKRLMRISPYMGVRLIQLDDETETQMARMAENADTFCAEDLGGRQVAEKLQIQVDKEAKLNARECFGRLVKGELLDDDKAKAAIAELRIAVEDFFRLEKIPNDIKGDIRVYGDTKHSRHKAVCQLLAFFARGTLKLMGCPAGRVPREIEEKLDDLASNDQERREYQAFIRSLIDWPMQMYIKFEEAYRYREYKVIAHPECRFSQLKAWLARAAKAKKDGTMDKLVEPGFSVSQLKEYCQYGLNRFLYAGSSTSFFALEPERTVSETDIFFRMACMWFRNHHKEKGQDIWFVAIGNSPEKSYFLVRNEKFTFVDMFAETDEADQLAGKLTPKLLRELLVGANSDCVTLERESYSDRFRLG